MGKNRSFTPTVRCYLAPAIVGAVLLVAVACGGSGDDDDNDSASSPSVTPTVSALGSPSPTGAESEGPRVVGGTTMYAWESWLARGGSLCASTSLEAPYLGPPVFGVRDDEVPAIALPPGRELLDARMCDDEEVTAVNYILDGSVWVVLASGPKEWAIDSRQRRLEELQEVSVGGHAAALLPATEATPGQLGPTGATLVVDAPFGLLVVYGSTLFNEEALSIASAIDLNAVTIPEADPTFVGEINGISFYDYKDSGSCRYGPMGSGSTESQAEPDG